MVKHVEVTFALCQVSYTTLKINVKVIATKKKNKSDNF